MSAEQHHLGGEERDPSADPTPLDRASFYLESLKYGPGPGQMERVAREQMANQLEVLLRDAGVTSMTGEELIEAARYYERSLTQTLGLPGVLARSCWLDGLMHGIALAGGLHGEPRDSPSPGEQLT